MVGRRPPWSRCGLSGIAALGWPRRTFDILIFLVGALLLLDGALAALSVFRSRTGARSLRFYLSVLEGVVGVAAGIAILVLPELSRLVLIYMAAGWALITGVLTLGVARRLRRVVDGEWILAASGGLSVAFGVLLALQPAIEAATLMWMLGAYALTFGVLLLALGYRLRIWTADTGLDSSEPEARR